MYSIVAARLFRAFEKFGDFYLAIDGLVGIECLLDFEDLLLGQALVQVLLHGEVAEAGCGCCVGILVTHYSNLLYCFTSTGWISTELILLGNGNGQLFKKIYECSLF